MHEPLKIKLFITFLLLSLTFVQGYAVHASQSIYQSLAERSNYADFLMDDYLKYYP